MNKTNLKRYAPQARKDFIEAVTARAHMLGLTEVAGQLHAEPCQINGNVAVIAGRAWPASVEGKRERLLQRMKRDGYAATLDAVAYTWFNRFAALRYMELHDYLGHGRRVLSNPDGGLPEILSHALELAEVGELPGLQAEQVRQLKLDNQDSELFRRVLVAQCNALHSAMPFLFERIDDDSELLLPDNLLRSDSVITKLVAEIPEEDWVEVEIIGWLYQFYISEKKDQVIGKVVKSEDIPAATQLFTPNWIVQYLVQNSVGRLWLMANPHSTLASEWPYYITPAEQTPEVQAQLDALIQTRVREDGDTLNPESITVLDPACGSGHILVVAYDVLKAMYLERGYQPRAIPRLILEKNLYGLDIDDRAAQMACFALLMKARADDRRLFTATDDSGNLQPPKLNVLSLQESKGLSVDELATHLAPLKVQRATISSLVETFEHAKTFGSLIQIPHALKTHLAELPGALALVKQSGDMYASAAADDLMLLVQQAQLLAKQFDAVVANPPYMGSKYHNPIVKSYLKEQYPGFEKDLFAAFTARNSYFGKPGAEIAVMSSNVWMFLSSYEEMRYWLIDNNSLNTLVHLSNSGFDGATVFICAFTFSNRKINDFLGSFIRLTDFSRSVDQGPKTLEAIKNKKCGWFYTAKSDEFRKIPGGLIGYWLSEKSLNCFLWPKLGQYFEPQVGLQTSNTDRFIRLWPEVSFTNFCIDSQSNQAAAASGIKWFPLDKGGEFRRWYGNNTHAVNWIDNGAEIKHYVAEKYPYLNGNVDYVIKDRGYFFRPGVTWGKISSGAFSVRATYGGSIFSDAGMKVPTSSSSETEKISGFLNSTVSLHFLKCLSPTLNFEKGSIASLPFKELESPVVRSLVEIYKKDWDEFEGSYNFAQPYMLATNISGGVSLSWAQWRDESSKRISKAKQLEEENNRIYIDAYGLQDELTPEVPESQITLARADREKDSQRLISYAIGCMMGRYSLDEPGLIYAHAGNVGFEPGRYATFPADADGIVPITDELWFADDACSCIREFLRAVWGPDTLEENMAWLAESLGTKASETPDESIRRYIADKFFKDHLQTYKKRPIYWLFSSGKQGAFQALVYLHRYHEGTLARLRSEYVVPLTGKILSRIEMLEKDAAVASSTSVRNKLNKEVEKLKKKHIELLAYDEKLRHYADMRITLDLDDGVKVNYGKFGDLLDSVKIVTGGPSDD